MRAEIRPYPWHDIRYDNLRTILTWPNLHPLPQKRKLRSRMLVSACLCLHSPRCVTINKHTHTVDILSGSFLRTLWKYNPSFNHHILAQTKQFFTRTCRTYSRLPFSQKAEKTYSLQSEISVGDLVQTLYLVSTTSPTLISDRRE
jgi:hypothetical protein